MTLRVVGGIQSLRRGDVVKAVWKSIARSHKPGFRVVHFNVEPNHMHFITEARDRHALARGVQGLEVSLAKRVNRVLGRTGDLFEERYHSRSLRTPREARNALRYVINNARHHALEHGQILAPTWIDPYSSAIWFDGWAEPIVADESWKRDLLAMTPPVASPTFWLLTTGWRRHGLIRFDEIPGVRAHTRRRR